MPWEKQLLHSYIDFLNSFVHGGRIGVTQGRDEDASTMTPKKIWL